MRGMALIALCVLALVAHPITATFAQPPVPPVATGSVPAPKYVTFVRKDRLPPLVGKYELGLLGTTAKDFSLGRVRWVKDPAIGLNPEEDIVVSWGQAPDGKPVTEPYSSETCDAIRTGSDSQWSVLLAQCQPADGKPRQWLYLFQDLERVGQWDLSDRKVYLRALTPQGEVQLTLADDPRTALFMTRKEGITSRTYPGTFLSRDSSRKRDLYAVDTTLFAVDDGKETWKAVLPFPVIKGNALENGMVMAGSRRIGNGGPSWRVILDETGKVLSEAAFGEWHAFPQARGRDPRTGKFDLTLERWPADLILTNPAGYWPESALVLRRLKNLEPERSTSILPSSAFHPDMALDRSGCIYTLMSQEPDPGNPPSGGYVLVQSLWHPPVTLVTHSDVAELLNAEKKVGLYSMDVSPDGDWLAVIVRTNWVYDESENWWLLQFKIAPREVPRRPAAQVKPEAPVPGADEVKFRDNEVLLERVSQQTKAKIEARPNAHALTVVFTENSSNADFATVTELPWLKRVVIWGGRVTDLSPLANLKELTSLDLRDTRVNDLQPLAALANLQSLVINGDEDTLAGPLDMTPLQGLKHMESLCLQDVQLANEDALAGCTVKSLTVTGMNNVSLSCVAHMPNLEGLFADSCPRARSLKPLSACHTLRWIRLNVNNRKPLPPEEYTVLAGRAELETLEVSAVSVSNLAFVAGCPKLRRLDLPSAGQLESLQGIETLPALKEFRVAGTKLQDVSLLAACKNLADLELGGKEIQDLSPLQTLVHLKTFRLEDSPRVSADQLDALRRALPNCRITRFSRP